MFFLSRLISFIIATTTKDIETIHRSGIHLLTLINNILEIRLDGIKLVTLWRRPLAKKAQDIGIWNQILKGLSVISVLTNVYTLALSLRSFLRVYACTRARVCVCV